MTTSLIKRYGTVIPADSGPVKTVELPEDVEARVAVLQNIVGGYLQAVPLQGGRHMVLDEEGKLKPHLINRTATDIARDSQSIPVRDYIAGIAVIVPFGTLE